MNTPSKQAKQSEKKYRPYLSESNIRHILSLSKADTPLSLQSKELIRIFAPLLSKIENEATVAAYVSNPRPSLMDRLSDTDESTAEGGVRAASLIELRRAAYNKWFDAPEECTIQELEHAYEYRVANNLLTPEEQAKEDASWNDVDMSKYNTLDMKEGD